MKTKINSFPAIVDQNTEVLILGTMPGAMSLEKYEYYGFPQNQFWKIMFTLLDELPVPSQFDQKAGLLLNKKVGLWDVLATCERKGSLDINIKNHIVNDIPLLLKFKPNIKTILFNGKDSHKFFMRAFGVIEGVALHVMPSTSPANTIKFDVKLEAWRSALMR